MLLLAVLLLLCPDRNGQAQSMEVPVRIQFGLFSKIVSFNRSDHGKHNDDFVLGVLYQKAVRASVEVADEASALAAQLLFDGRKVRVVSIPLSSSTDLDAALVKLHPDALYVAPMRSADIDAISRSSRRLQVLTLTGVSSFVDDGLAVGIAQQGNRPQVLINLAASKAEGADFSSQLLRVSKIIP
jgi:hypothetical protein